MAKHKSPIKQSIALGCVLLTLALSVLLALQTRGALSDAITEQYQARLRDVLTSVQHETDADDLRTCIETGESSPRRDELQQRLNRMVDDYELAYLYVAVVVRDGQNVMINAVSATSEAERAAGEENMPLLFDATEYYAPEELARYASAWRRPDISFFEETSDYGPCYTGCLPLKDSNGDTVALICADYAVDTLHESVRRHVIRNVLVIVAVCAAFGTLLALWLRRNVTAPIRALEQSALRFAKMTHEIKNTDELNFDTASIDGGSNEVKLLVNAMIELSKEMKSQVRDAVSAEKRANEAEQENVRLSEKAETAIKIAELTQSVTSLLTNMPGLTFSKDVETRRYLACNQAFAEYAHKKSPEDVVGLTDEEIFDEATAKHFLEDDNKALAMDEPYVFHENVLDAMGNECQFQTTKLKFTDATGRLCLLGMCIDFTELMRVKRETVRAKEAYERAQTASAMYSHIVLALSASYSSLYYVNLKTNDFIEYRSNDENGELGEERQGKDFFNQSAKDAAEQIYPEDLEGFIRAFTRENVLRAVENEGAFTLSYRLMVGGEAMLVNMKASKMQDDEEHLLIGVNAADLNATNEMTGLYTESAFFVRGGDILREHAEGWCVLAIDLENFKLFNEWYGRNQGDKLLAEVGALLKSIEEQTGGLAGYLGQDDFALLMPYDKAGVEKLYGDCHKLIIERGTSVGFMPAVGVCMTDGASGVEELYDHAALAGRHAKENFHHRIRVFDSSMVRQTEEDYRILSDFQKALRDRELFIMLQPQCRIDTGHIVGAESLVRWKKADGKMVSPGVFVPVLERYGFVTDLDKFVWEEVCRWQRQWIDGGNTPLPVSVNVSQIDIFSIDVAAYFDALIKKYDLPVDVIKVEITESAYVGDDAVADTVTRLRERGFLVLMDDFGSGYSSLNMLRNLNVDIIKLDAQFLRMNANDRKGVHILESIVNMAKTMGVPIIVEGVETGEETEFIKSLGCRYVQGYYFYRPVPAADFEALIAKPENIDAGGFVFKLKEEFHTREFLDQNVYSDTMLNNILGPVAFFNLHDGEIDCIRYNEQFANEINSAQFGDLLVSAQRLVLPDDIPVVYGLLEQAMRDPLGGAADIVRFRRADGTVAQFRIQFFFLEEDENGKRFYGSMHDVTQLDRLASQIRMLSRLSNDEVVLLRRRENGVLFQVSVHGLEETLGVTREEFEQELNSGAFEKRLEPGCRERLEKLIRDADGNMADFSPPFTANCAGGEARLQMRFETVREKSSGVEHVVVLRRSAAD
ncbi:MAG: EAL domain-containing protein [Oscillospiraceae bacterium]|nr:EAL domain-containing protein [Oscillospiraceae bacterium]